jgi:periplasmic protein TonB
MGTEGRNQDAEQRAQPKWYRLVPLIAGGALVLVVTIALVLVVRNMQKKPEGPKRQTAQTVKLIRPPPPPDQPPPPPPPPPEKVDEPLPQDTPEPTPDDQAPAEQLGLDADGAAGSDGFGLAARKGGSDLIGSSTQPFRWYTDMVASRIQECLSDDERIRKGSYRANVRVLVRQDGQLEIEKLIGTTGSKEKDAAILSMTRRCDVGRDKPIEMPQLITLQIVSRG